ncbi:16S rRNA (cytidine(1402)-2'-O)-methyltransferase [Pseudoclavibacter sp. CFCC 14310]|uniref:16S rRNA (cytidine(1402)-2'-O)-methyltransferase n=1 Tax=Pseudoclavibacter sp. CFCC 14310 TaxID=2615180 RepID=UPI0013014062|nr:16S rRNA (cytidine(1402)-2'-O)-methyltransferase [Pseudoclavibacter sp. CFCC 14310]KAB1647336.1 16S rRNA (cytidine(1402)-2'-O)-methyltransferase [Pseudoclavibacter sp. CFCC 14310]
MIILAGTPIGNAGDASPRLIELLENAEIVAAEDTRNTLHLFDVLGVENRPRMISMHEYNERERIDELLDLARDHDVVVVTDAGMPTISDPGFQLGAAAREAGVTVTSVPGPTAVLTALAVSGLPTDRFSFEGFVPRRPGERTRLWRALADEQRTMIFYESPHRVAEALASMIEVFGADRAASVSRELTKRFEHTERGSLGHLAEWAAEGVRGEVVIVIAGAPARIESPDDHVDAVLALVAEGRRLKEASAEVAERTGVSRKALYDLALQRRAER